MKNVTAVFDIGKTNKKFFLFDAHFQEVYREYIAIDTIVDEDGHSTEDLISLQKWIKNLFHKMLTNEKFNITALNFSTYGASMVHLDENGKVLTPLYNYTKPLDQKIIDTFFKNYGPEDDFAIATGSSNSGMLNSGLQLYWLKQTRPEIFKKIKYSLHLPQFISYIFTGIPLSEYTSIGCHTALWDYNKNEYHTWVYKEGIHQLLCPIVPTETSINMNYNGQRIKIGVGIHDSSAALLPYIRSIKKKFVLVSTGTWSVTLNPFSEQLLSKKEVAHDCINYMRINGKPIKSSRLFLGNEYKLQVAFLSELYRVKKDYHKKVKFSYDTFIEISQEKKPVFHWINMVAPNMPSESKIAYANFEMAYHRLLMELVLLQVESIKVAKGNDKINRIYVDGGFSDNEVYIQLLAHYLPKMKLRTTDASLGSALGAALAISEVNINSKFLKKNYSLKKHLPSIMK